MRGPPKKLLDAIFQKRLEFYDAAATLTPDEIKGMIPITFPMTHIIDRNLFPGIGRFNVEKADAENQPYFSKVSWIALCRKIAACDMHNLASIFDLCSTLGGSD